MTIFISRTHKMQGEVSLTITEFVNPGHMKNYIYLTTPPEALIASMLPPKDFGNYLSRGTKNRNRGEAIFFQIDPYQIEGMIDIRYLESRCKPKPDGSPKSSVYLSVYRVLERVPLSAFMNLYLTTENGFTLELKKMPYNKPREKETRIHLYQELCPVTPLVASILPPAAFMKKLTDGSSPIVLPKLLFVDLKLGELANNPVSGSGENLPYHNLGHLRDCLEILEDEEGKDMKTVLRFFYGSLLFRTIEDGFFLGGADGMIYYPYPELLELEMINYDFFRSI